jgi:hypothetical protein
LRAAVEAAAAVTEVDVDEKEIRKGETHETLKANCFVVRL